MHYYITRAESGKRACQEAQWDIPETENNAWVRGAISESGEVYEKGEGCMEGFNIPDAEFDVRQMMDMHTLEHRAWTSKIRGYLEPWMNGNVTGVLSYRAEDAAEYFSYLQDVLFYQEFKQSAETFMEGLEFRQGRLDVDGATNTLEWNTKGEVWVVFIETD